MSAIHATVPSNRESDAVIRHKHLKQTGFTLIEVLVVISITALLMSVLLPAMSEGRVRAKLVVCQRNLSQIMVAFVGYANENSDFVPVAAAHELGGATGCVDKDDPWLPVRMFGGCLPAEERPLNPYLGNAYAVFKCPADKGEPIWWIADEPPEASHSAYKVYGSSYFYASGHNGLNGVFMPMGLAKLVGLDFSFEAFREEPLPNGQSLQLTSYCMPSKKVVIGDIPIHRTMSGAIAVNPRGQWHRRDPNHLWANAAFLDGHVEFVQVFPYDSPPYQGITTKPSRSNPYY
jgi:prepilin-type N-terminal cleavage/methylation domain-containing protein/prepilin-type processing-associated H-X9-DG protein